MSDQTIAAIQAVGIAVLALIGAAYVLATTIANAWPKSRAGLVAAAVAGDVRQLLNVVAMLRGAPAVDAPKGLQPVAPRASDPPAKGDA